MTSVRKNNPAQLYLEGKQLEEKARRMAELARAKGSNTTLQEVLEADDIMIESLNTKLNLLNSL